MGFSPIFRDQVLNGLIPSPLYLSINTADPGTTGANELAGVVRQSVSLNTSTGNAGRTTGQAIMDPHGSTVSHYSVWDAGSGGNFLWSGTLGATQAATFLLSVTLSD